MRISVIGCGYLGAVHAACMAKLGHDVMGIDVDPRRINDLQAGRAPFFEPGLPELLDETLTTGRLKFSSSMADASGADVHFLCVGTPQRKGEYGADLRHVDSAVASLLDALEPGNLIVGKSTVPVGTAARLADDLSRQYPDAVLAWNPEFLREGFAIDDTLSPDRLVYGLPAGEAGLRATRMLDAVYATPLSTGTPRLCSDYATAELVKAAANSFLATKISFINAMAEICEATGADVNHLAKALSLDDRIGGRFLKPGLGFGGGCLPKDIRAFKYRAEELGVGQAVSFLGEVDSINNRRRVRTVDLIRELAGGSLDGVRVAALGAAFKPNSDDVRDAPALDVARLLYLEGAIVSVYDPEANANAHRRYPDLNYVGSMAEAVDQADVVALLTEWSEFRNADPDALGALVNHRRIVDGRHALDANDYTSKGWQYRALGRPAQAGTVALASDVRDETPTLVG